MVRTYCQISCIWQSESFTYNQYPIVDILCSGPAMNTRSRKQNIVIPDPMAHIDDDALNQQYFFALPSSLDPNDVVQLIQPDTISYNLADLEEEDFAEWRRMKEQEARARWMRRIRERAGILKQLKKELRQVHKLSRTENGFPGIRWWHLKYWDIKGRVKKEEPTSLTIVNIKVKSPSTPFPITHHPFITLPIPWPQWFRKLGGLHYCLDNQFVLFIQRLGIWYHY